MCKNMKYIQDMCKYGVYKWFVCIAKMDYKGAKGWLRKVEEESDNQIELAIADVHIQVIGLTEVWQTIMARKR